ncbi:MAG: hypothetical protein ACLRSW_02915 [Christensenellaceae bacterium]
MRALTRRWHMPRRGVLCVGLARKATEGGGVLINQALHTLDLPQWLSAARIRRGKRFQSYALTIEGRTPRRRSFRAGRNFPFATVGSAAIFPFPSYAHRRGDDNPASRYRADKREN